MRTFRRPGRARALSLALLVPLVVVALSGVAEAKSKPKVVVMPQLTGQRLDKAKKAMQKAAKKASIKVADARGHRSIGKTSNWVVETQDPASGTAVAGTAVIHLGVRNKTDSATPSVNIVQTSPTTVAVAPQPTTTTTAKPITTTTESPTTTAPPAT